MNRCGTVDIFCFFSSFFFFFFSGSREKKICIIRLRIKRASKEHSSPEGLGEEGFAMFPLAAYCQVRESKTGSRQKKTS